MSPRPSTLMRTRLAGRVRARGAARASPTSRPRRPRPADRDDDRVFGAEKIVETALRHPRCRGVWPFRPRLNRKPDDDLAPLCPRDAVSPWPEPGPRPTRRFCFAPFGGRRLFSDITHLPLLRDGGASESGRGSPGCRGAPPCAGSGAGRSRAARTPACLSKPISLRICVIFSVFRSAFALSVFFFAINDPPRPSFRPRPCRAAGRLSADRATGRVPRRSPAPRCARWPSRATSSARC